MSSRRKLRTVCNNSFTQTWRSWCRLCARNDFGSVKTETTEQTNGECENNWLTMDTTLQENQLDDFNLSTAVEKFLGVDINDKKLPQLICPDCYSMTKTVVNFIQRIEKVQRMYVDLKRMGAKTKLSTQDLYIKYGLVENQECAVLLESKVKSKVNKLPDLNQMKELEEVLLKEEKSCDLIENVECIFDAIKEEEEEKENTIKSDSLANIHSGNGDPFEERMLGGNCDVSGDEQLLTSITTANANNDCVDNTVIGDSRESSNSNKPRSAKSKKRKHPTKKDSKETETTKQALESRPSSRRKTQNQHAQDIHDKTNTTKNPNVDDDGEFLTWKSSKSNNETSDVDQWDDIDNSVSDELYEPQSTKSKKRKYCRKKTSNAADSSVEGSKSFPCLQCSQKFKSDKTLSRHAKQIHNTELLLPCDQCERTFTTQRKLKEHLKTHIPLELKRIHPCPYCENKFTSTTSVQTHIKHIHLKERPFICEECGAALKTAAILQDHLRSHSDDAPYECEICQKRFKDKKRLHRHLDTHGPKNYECPECGLKLNSRITLRGHMLVHSNEMPHKCDFCGRAFKRARSLKVHLILHTGLKPYVCCFCGRGFGTGSSCRLHKRMLHPQELAAQEASGEQAYTHNIPKLETLKELTKTAKNLQPVICLHNGRYKDGTKWHRNAKSRAKASKTTPVTTNDLSMGVPQSAAGMNAATAVESSIGVTEKAVTTTTVTTSTCVGNAATDIAVLSSEQLMQNIFI